MHLLPLPFGLALALLPRREVDRIRRRELVRPHIRSAARSRERFVNDFRYFRV
jgi:hypothetical protein